MPIRRPIHMTLNGILRMAGPGTALLLTLSLAGPPASALASCAALPPLEDAIAGSGSVFVGVVVEASNRQRDAVVEVEQVWKGKVDERVEVRGGPQGADVISSVDRAYVEDRRYLFVPYEGDGQVFRDNICTATQPFEEDLAVFRPAGASATPSPTGALGTEPSSGVVEPPSRGRWVLPGMIALVLAGAVILTLRLSARRSGDGSEQP